MPSVLVSLTHTTTLRGLPHHLYFPLRPSGQDGFEPNFSWVGALRNPPWHFYFIFFLLLMATFRFCSYFPSLPLGFDTSILPICKDSLGWMFNRLDTNYDLLLDQSELGSIYLDKNEQCTEAFFNSCDTYRDRSISNNEWCYCFQRQQGTVPGARQPPAPHP